MVPGSSAFISRAWGPPIGQLVTHRRHRQGHEQGVDGKQDSTQQPWELKRNGFHPDVSGGLMSKPQHQVESTGISRQPPQVGDQSGSSTLVDCYWMSSWSLRDLWAWVVPHYAGHWVPGGCSYGDLEAVISDAKSKPLGTLGEVVIHIMLWLMGLWKNHFLYFWFLLGALG